MIDYQKAAEIACAYHARLAREIDGLAMEYNQESLETRLAVMMSGVQDFEQALRLAFFQDPK